MPDKGKIMSQAYYEKQSKLFQLYKESFSREEMNSVEAASALRVIGFSNTIATRRVKEWAEKGNNYEPETGKAKNRRLKQQASLERYVLFMRYGRK